MNEVTKSEATRNEETRLTLFQADENLLALLNSEDLVGPEEEAQFQADLAAAFAAAEDKRESFGQFLLFLESQQEAAKKEIDRIKRRAEAIANLERRLKRIAVRVIKSWGADSKGKLRKLIGRTVTMYARALPSSVDIQNEDLVPEKYKRATIQMPLAMWRKVAETCPAIDIRECNLTYVTVVKEMVERDLVAMVDVPGADLRLPGHDHSLVVK